MRFIVMSKGEIERHEFTEPCVVISIRSPKCSWARIKGCGQVQEILKLRFSDSTPTEGFRFPKMNPEALQVDMTFEQAYEIVGFVRRHADAGIRVVYVHCLGGVSRSRGVVCALMTLYGQPNATVAADGDPNPWVEQLVLQAGREREGSGPGGPAPEEVQVPGDHRSGVPGRDS